MSAFLFAPCYRGMLMPLLDLEDVVMAPEAIPFVSAEEPVTHIPIIVPLGVCLR